MSQVLRGGGKGEVQLAAFNEGGRLETPKVVDDSAGSQRFVGAWLSLLGDVVVRLWRPPPILIFTQLQGSVCFQSGGGDGCGPLGWHQHHCRQEAL